MAKQSKVLFELLRKLLRILPFPSHSEQWQIWASHSRPHQLGGAVQAEEMGASSQDGTSTIYEIYSICDLLTPRIL